MPSLAVAFSNCRIVHHVNFFRSRYRKPINDAEQPPSPAETNSSTTGADSTITASTSTTSSAARDKQDLESASEEMILACCEAGEITKVRLWTSRGVNVLFSERSFMRAAAYA
jgi:hypothetical protein